MSVDYGGVTPDKMREWAQDKTVYTSPGAKWDSGKLPWHLCPLSFVAPLVPVFAHGLKYGLNNWKESFDTPEMTEEQRFISAMKRHLEAVEEGGALAINEKDGGVYHAAQIAWNSLRLIFGALRRSK